jgi:hypothetical protein
LHQRARNRDASLQRICGGLISHAISERSEQPVLGGDRLFAGIHEQKTSSAVSVLGFAGIKARLADQCRLLIPKIPAAGTPLSDSRVATPYTSLLDVIFGNIGRGTPSAPNSS